MVDPEIISKEPITLTELKSELKAIKKRDTELSFRGNRTEYRTSRPHGRARLKASGMVC